VCVWLWLCFSSLYSISHHNLLLKIVLSTTWRVDPDAIQLVTTQLKPSGLEIFSTTPIFQEFSYQDPSITRVYEIHAWLSLDHSFKIKNWIALDDMDLSLKSVVNFNKKDPATINKIKAHQRFIDGHFVQTNPSLGLCRSDAERAVQLLHKSKGK